MTPNIVLEEEAGIIPWPLRCVTDIRLSEMDLSAVSKEKFDANS